MLAALAAAPAPAAAQLTTADSRRRAGRDRGRLRGAWRTRSGPGALCGGRPPLPGHPRRGNGPGPARGAGGGRRPPRPGAAIPSSGSGRRCTDSGWVSRCPPWPMRTAPSPTASVSCSAGRRATWPAALSHGRVPSRWDRRARSVGPAPGAPGRGWAGPTRWTWAPSATAITAIRTGTAVVATALAGGLAGILAGGLLARGEITEGTAASTYLGSLWGAWVGLAGANVLDLDDEATLTSTLLVGNAGLLAGALVGSRFDLLLPPRAHDQPRRPDRRLRRDRHRAHRAAEQRPASVFAIPLATSAAGLVLGALLTRESAGAANGESSASPAGSSPLAGALLNGSGGRLAVGVPMPFPTTVHDPERTGRRHTAWNVPLLRLRF